MIPIAIKIKNFKIKKNILIYFDGLNYYKLYILNNLKKYNQNQDCLTLWISHIIKNQQFKYFGFLDEEEKNFFDELINNLKLTIKKTLIFMNKINYIDFLDLIREKKLKKLETILKKDNFIITHFSQPKILKKFLNTNKIPKKIIIDDKEILVSDLFENLKALGYSKNNIITIFHQLKNKKYVSEEDFYKDYLVNLQNFND